MSRQRVLRRYTPAGDDWYAERLNARSRFADGLGRHFVVDGVQVIAACGRSWLERELHLLREERIGDRHCGECERAIKRRR